MAWLILLALGVLAFVVTRAATAEPKGLAKVREPDAQTEPSGDGARPGEDAGTRQAGQPISAPTNAPINAPANARADTPTDDAGSEPGDPSDDPDGVVGGSKPGSDPVPDDPDDAPDGLDGTRRTRELADDDELAEPDRLARLIEDASLDDPLLRDAIETGIAFTAGAVDHPALLADLARRFQRPSRFGRLDLTIAWRRKYHVLPIGVVLDVTRVAARDATTYEYRIDDTFLVFATWRI